MEKTALGELHILAKKVLSQLPEKSKEQPPNLKQTTYMIVLIERAFAPLTQCQKYLLAI